MSDVDCGQTLLLQAEFDGELDAAHSAALAAHRETCARCREDWVALTATRAALAAGATYHKAPDSLRRALAARYGAAPAGPSRVRRYWWRELAGFGLGAALAAMLLLMVRPSGESGVLAALVDDHVRSLQPGHFTDVISTDKHTVKPWFDGKLDFAPPVKDLAAQGYPLIGGRLDYLGGRPVAALAYQHGKHPINLYIWPERSGADAGVDASRDGYNLLHWSADGMAVWAVSDLERDELQEFERDWRAAP
jgi:anti-sigma factor RsiW